MIEAPAVLTDPPEDCSRLVRTRACMPRGPKPPVTRGTFLAITSRLPSRYRSVHAHLYTPVCLAAAAADS
jgi:hypothetical protein